jgi:hypothetical protein
MLRLLIIYFSPKNVAPLIFPESQNETLPKIPQNVQWITGEVRGFAEGTNGDIARPALHLFGWIRFYSPKVY